MVFFFRYPIPAQNPFYDATPETNPSLFAQSLPDARRLVTAAKTMPKGRKKVAQKGEKCRKAMLVTIQGVGNAISVGTVALRCDPV